MGGLHDGPAVPDRAVFVEDVLVGDAQLVLGVLGWVSVTAVLSSDRD